MLRPWLYIGSIFLCLSWANRPAHADTVNDGAAAATALSTPATTASSTPATTSTISTSPVSPVTSNTIPGPTAPVDASSSPKFYTISVALREIYDNNIFTATTGRVSSFETQISPSILFDFPKENSDFSLRETFTTTYYTNRPGDQFDFNNEVVASFQHSFSERFSMNVSDQFGYYTEPSLFQNVGTLYYNGSYLTNTFNGSFNAQWTPLISTLLTYSNTVVDYENSATATQNNSVENTGSGTLGFAILPKINLNFGGIVDDITYNQVDRGYTSLTGNTGINWQALPTLSINLAVGGSVTETDLGNSEPSPYGALGVNWQIGARSVFSFNYSHSVVPTDVVQAMGQIADRIGTNFRYDIIPNLSTHLEGTYTHGVYTPWLISPNTISGYSENDFAIDAGFTYHVNSHFDVNLGDTYSGVVSGLNFRDYNRNQFYLGVRGTY